MNTEIMTIKEVAEYLKLTEKTAYRLAAEGKIPGFKVGGSWRFTRGEIDAWIAKQLKQQGHDKQHQDQRGKC
ncbi:MAG: helix-turn-helix domain-containing protein [Gammaproteobacteria bacterium]|nr:helix-turn-helix domain-containing protein [Gammaproteobacteria bacterium]